MTVRTISIGVPDNPSREDLEKMAVLVGDRIMRMGSRVVAGNRTSLTLTFYGELKTSLGRKLHKARAVHRVRRLGK